MLKKILLPFLFIFFTVMSFSSAQVTGGVGGSQIGGGKIHTVDPNDPNHVRQMAVEFRAYEDYASSGAKRLSKPSDDVWDQWSPAKQKRFYAYQSVVSNPFGRNMQDSSEQRYIQNQLDENGLFDTIVENFKRQGSLWEGIFLKYAKWLFITLAVISLTIKLGHALLEGSEAKNVFVVLLKFILITGFFWWVLINGSRMAEALITSLQQVGTEAGGSPVESLTPSSIVDVGINLLNETLEHTTWKDVAGSIMRVAVGGVTLIILALIAVKYAILMITAWIIAYTGIFVLGLSALDEMREVVYGYLKMLLAYALQIMTFLLIIGVSYNIAIGALRGGATTEALWMSLISVIIMYILVEQLPGIISGMVSGVNVYSGGSAMSGAITGAATGAMAGAVAGGMQVAGGALNAVGGALSGGASIASSMIGQQIGKTELGNKAFDKMAGMVAGAEKFMQGLEDNSFSSRVADKMADSGGGESEGSVPNSSGGASDASSNKSE